MHTKFMLDIYRCVLISGRSYANPTWLATVVKYMIILMHCCSKLS